MINYELWLIFIKVEVELTEVQIQGQESFETRKQKWTFQEANKSNWRYYDMYIFHGFEQRNQIPFNGNWKHLYKYQYI